MDKSLYEAKKMFVFYVNLYRFNTARPFSMLSIINPSADGKTWYLSLQLKAEEMLQ